MTEKIKEALEAAFIALARVEEKARRGFSSSISLPFIRRALEVALGRCASCVITLRRVRVDTSTSGALVPVYEVIAVALTKGPK